MVGKVGKEFWVGILLGNGNAMIFVEGVKPVTEKFTIRDSFCLQHVGFVVVCFPPAYLSAGSVFTLALIFPKLYKVRVARLAHNSKGFGANFKGFEIIGKEHDGNGVRGVKHAQLSGFRRGGRGGMACLGPRWNKQEEGDDENEEGYEKQHIHLHDESACVPPWEPSVQTERQE